ncbi:MAG: RNA polymerase sporulation sigma factor SigH [bacterium]
MQTLAREYFVNFHGMGDEDIVVHAREGCKQATEHLLSKYRSIVEGKARSYFLVGADHEDIVQEGMIGLFKAIRDFRNDRMLPFRAFAELCISRQIFTAIKAATRQKHIPLNSYVSLHANLYDSDSDRTLIDTIAETATSDPEEVVITQQFTDDLRKKIKNDLSSLESAVLRSHLEGKSYQEIAGDLNRRVKSIDNALQRAKRKIGRSLKMMMAAT